MTFHQLLTSKFTIFIFYDDGSFLIVAFWLYCYSDHYWWETKIKRNDIDRKYTKSTTGKLPTQFSTSLLFFAFRWPLAHLQLLTMQMDRLKQLASTYSIVCGFWFRFVCIYLHYIFAISCCTPVDLAPVCKDGLNCEFSPFSHKLCEKIVFYMKAI